MVLDRVTPAAYDYAFYPSDLNYADLAMPDGTFEDWNAAHEGFHAGYFGEVRGEKNKQDPINFDQADYRPEIAVGRWPVSTPEEVACVAAKTIVAEKAALANQDERLRRAALLAVSGWVDSRPLLDRCAARLTNGWGGEKRYYSDRRGPSSARAPSPAEVRDLFNGGVGLVVHTGHGQPDAWEQCYSVADLDHPTNATRLPVVMSVGCSTAHFAPLPPYGPYVDVNGKEHVGTDHGEAFSAPRPSVSATRGSPPLHCEKTSFGLEVAALDSVLLAEPHPLLVGGQAVNLWAQVFLGERPELGALRPFVSRDCDVVGDVAMLQGLAGTGQWKATFSRKGQASPVVGFLSGYLTRAHEGVTSGRYTERSLVDLLEQSYSILTGEQARASSARASFSRTTCTRAVSAR
jgi:hypothetical protein